MNFSRLLFFLFSFAVRPFDARGAENSAVSHGLATGQLRLVEKDIVQMVNEDFRNSISNSKWLWPSGVIPYTAVRMSSYAKSNLNKVFRLMESKTCLRFVPRTNERDYLAIVANDGCWSHVGRTGGQQELSLDTGCHSMNTIAHELMHAIGFYHEHNRYDRDEYIDIRFENVRSSAREEFKKNSKRRSRVFRDFDFDSTLLYQPTEFSKNGEPTMVSKRVGKEVRKDRFKPVMSAGDFLSINALYKCAFNEE